MTGLLNRAIADMPVAVLDFETTGMWPGEDRVVEASVVRVEPGRGPELIFDTLVNPNRRMNCTFVHGITDQDVADAPRFEQIARRLLEALSGCVVAAYNVSFDMRFLEYELDRVAYAHSFPQICLMYMRPLLGLGRHCRLGEACRAHGVSLTNAHAAAADALAAAHLWTIYRDTMTGLGLQTYADLQARKAYKFTRSFAHEPHPPIAAGGPPGVPLKARPSQTAHRSGVPATC